MNIEGFFAHLESDIANNRTELRLLLINSTGVNIPIPLHLGDWTLEESMVRFGEESAKYMPKELKANMQRLEKHTQMRLRHFFSWFYPGFPPTHYEVGGNPGYTINPNKIIGSWLIRV